MNQLGANGCIHILRPMATEAVFAPGNAERAR